jgi:hypothetical protein
MSAAILTAVTTASVSTALKIVPAPVLLLVPAAAEAALGVFAARASEIQSRRSSTTNFHHKLANTLAETQVIS